MNEEEARIMSLGPAGQGKSRLVLKAARKEAIKELGWMAGLIGAAAIALSFVGGMRLQASQYDAFAQDNFPCAEDEGLMFSPEFGSDKVGCINIGLVD